MLLSTTIPCGHERNDSDDAPSGDNASVAVAPLQTAPLNVSMRPCSENDVKPTEETFPSAAPVCDRATLTMVSGPSIGVVYRLGATSVIGRSFECDIRIDDIRVSRTHARVIQESDARFVVEDLGSRNGIVRGNLMVTQAALADGDRLGIGPIFFRFSLADEAEEIALKRRYESSILDGLTGAVNRKHFDHRLAAELAYAKRHDVDLSLLMLDVDNFKRINDGFGHVAGDAALRQLADVVRRTLRLEDLFARYGGEEFAIVARGIGARGGLVFAERIRRRVEETAVGYAHGAPGLTVSIGIASRADCQDASAEALVALADRRLYVAKRDGRNCCRAG